MPPFKALRILPLILLILTGACSPSGTPALTTETATPLPRPTSVPPTPTRPAPEIPAGPLSLVSLYQVHVQAGDWTEGQGLANLLGMYTGETQSADILGDDAVQDFEATGLLRLADQYLAGNPDDPMHDVVQKQVNLLVPPLDQLERFSRKHSTSASIHLASLSLSPAYDTADSATCQHLWEDGFSDPNPVVCFEYDEQVVDGTSVRLYYPSWWAADDSRRARLEPIFQAASRAVHTYNAYGPDPLAPVTLVVTELAGTDPDTHQRNVDLHAMAVRGRAATPSCYVGVFPSLFDLHEDQSQQALAHEMFHCYQYQNLSAQERGPARDASDWWVEGSAEYFSNVVFPAVDYEHRWLGALPTVMREDSLTSWSYKSFIFFQYLENRPDTRAPGVIALLRAMPTSGGQTEQLAALSHYANMNAIFHEFAQAVADQIVIDTNGSAIPLAVPLAPDDVIEVTPGNIFGSAPFSVDIHRVVFPVGFEYGLTSRITGSPGQASARLESAPRSWAAIPTQVASGCGENRYLMLETQTGANPENSYELFLQATSTPGTDQCSCLTGDWRLDNESYLNHLNGLIEQAAPGTIEYTSVDGSLTAQFTEDGHLNQFIEGLIVSADMNVSGMPTQSLVITMDGDSSAAYLAEEGSLHYTSAESHLALSTSLNGQPLSNAPSDTFSSGPLGTGATYVCHENMLSLVPIYPNYSDLPPLTFTRLSP